MGGKLRRRPYVERRIRTFFGAEGVGETAVAHWLEDIRNATGRRHHHDVTNLGGGDILSLVENALKERKKRDLTRPDSFAKSFLLLDYDRYAQDGERTQEAIRIAQDKRLIMIWQSPNLEGLLLRLFPGCETLAPPADKTRQELEKQWSGYNESFSRRDLQDRLAIEDLRRAAKFDKHLSRLLDELDLGG